MHQQEITITKSARYFVEGTVNSKIKDVWFVCHGYGQLANYFLKKFEIIANDETLIIAPEGLHRFYVQGFSGRIGASWMTKEDRISDIKDYVHFLNSVYNELAQAIDITTCRINVLGFSQGGATVCRWLAQSTIKVDNLILWASVFPTDVAPDNQVFQQQNRKTYFVCGTNDEFITQEEVQKITTSISSILNDRFTFISFDGNHTIQADALLELKNKMNDL